MNSMIRADGSPRYAMIAMLLGAILNIALDPLFIFAFKWGIAGAAWATVIDYALKLCFVGSLKIIKNTVHRQLCFCYCCCF